VDPFSAAVSFYNNLLENNNNSQIKHCFVFLRVRTGYENHTDGPVRYKVSPKGTGWSSANFTVSGSVRRISVWAEVENDLGSAVSVTRNYTLWDIGETAAQMFLKVQLLHTSSSEK